MKHISDIIPEIEKIVPAREANIVPLGVGCYNLFKDGEKVKGKRLLTFKPYVDSFKSAEENHRNLQAEEKAIQAVFPSYRAPSLAQIKALQSARKAMTKEVMRDGAIAERGLPKASEVWLSRLA
jgi:hypothetical protein